MILAEESCLLAANNKYTRAETPIYVSNCTDTIQAPSDKPSNLSSVFPSENHYDDPGSEPSYVPCGIQYIATIVVTSTIPYIKHSLVPSLIPSSSPTTAPSDFQSAVEEHYDNPSFVPSYVQSVVPIIPQPEIHSSVP